MGKKPKKIWSFQLLNSTTSKVGGVTLILLSVMIPRFLGGSSSSNITQSETNLIDEQVTVPLPSRTLLPGERIRDVPLTHVNWPRSRLPHGIVLSTASYQNSIIEHSVEKLNPIPLSALKDTKKTNNPVAEGIPKGMRAITVRVDLESAVEGWVRSGTRVDVVLIKENRIEQRELKASVIADNVKVLSAGRSTEPEAASLFNTPSPATVTLLVTQEQALKIKAAASVGKLTFTMRGLQDNSPSDILSVSENQLRNRFGKQSSLEGKNLKGIAKGPDGKTWVLTEDSLWIKTKPAEKEKEISFSERNQTLLESNG